MKPIEQHTLSVENRRKLLVFVAIALLTPAILAVVFTLNQRPPATYVIDYLSDAEGYFPLKKAIIMNWGLGMILELPLIMIASILKKRFFKEQE